MPPCPSSNCCGHTIVGNCGCGPIPDTLYMIVNDSDGGFFQPCTIVRTASPSWVTALNRDTDVIAGVHSTRLSTVSFQTTIPGQGATLFTYYWWFGCTAVGAAPRFNIQRLFPPQTPPAPTAVNATPVFAWTAGLSGNTCSPFAMLTGSDMSSSPTTVNSHVNIKQTP